MSRRPCVLLAVPGTVPVRCPRWGRSPPRHLRDAPPLGPRPAGGPGPCPRGPIQAVGSRAKRVERREDGVLGASEMLPSASGGRARRRQPGSRHDALAH